MTTAPTTQNSTTVNGNIMTKIIADDVNGIRPDIKSISTCVDVNDYSGLAKITSYIISKKFATRKEWDDLLHKQRVASYFNAPFPETPMEFINVWTKHNNLAMDFKGNVRSKSFRTEQVNKLYEEFDSINEKLSTSTSSTLIGNLMIEKRMVQDRIKSCEIRPTLDVILRKLRIARDTFKLKFSDSQLSDSLDEWADNYKSSRRGEIFSSILYIDDMNERKKANEYLEKICDGLFDQNHLPKQAQMDVLRKFIWQVKRKIKGEHVTNHIMPVFTGPQGTGKSTFMHRFISPVAELSSPTDFKQLTDDRNISLFKNAILIVDEMGFADRSDIETVKSIMTATELSRRPMRQNTSVQISQDATLIGASNKEIDQLIRDETGLRRFIGVSFKVKPDWDAIKNIDYGVIWRSVDEDGEDPSYGSMEDIKIVQEYARGKTSCEMWVNTLSEKNNGSKTASNWYNSYRIWESMHFHRKSMDFDVWCKELRRLIACNVDYPFTYSLNGSKEIFEYNAR